MLIMAHIRAMTINTVILILGLFFLSGCCLERDYRQRLPEVGITVAMEIVKAPSKFIEGRDYYGIIVLSNLQDKSAPTDTIIVGLWPDSPFRLSLAINRETKEMVLYDNYEVFPVLVTSNCFHLTEENRHDTFFNEPYFEKHLNPFNNTEDIYSVNSEYIIVAFDTNVRNNGFRIFAKPGVIAYAPWPWHTAKTIKELKEMFSQYAEDGDISPIQ